ncbi:MAG: Glycosyl transferase group 1 [Candidatus Falkowbacteria bacterium GW2011_GWF2_39_8]|uniref:Glycosyl transferase group 1 n=1 Tax=Candidatus Falkowbacteria bacterium GW2011_GWF2_39_8 TaxID=1618642 RepID=A0A0G0PTY4_9BACT|nr:MAG: Glycosyl transferase group 1 [Candidatus Falkowbacteria bacterium GW2011_GWF2_39_8]
MTEENKKIQNSRLREDDTEKNMKILLLTLEYPPFFGGVSSYYYNLVNTWNKKADLVPIVVLNNNDNSLINNKLPALKWLPSIFQLWKNIKKNNIDHVIVGNILPLGTATFFVAKFLPIKYSIILHGMDLAFALKTPRKKNLAIKILNKAENIICSNSFVAQLAKEFVTDENKIKVVTPGLDVQDILNNKLRDTKILETELITKYNLQEKYILFSSSRIVKRKGMDQVIKSMPKLISLVPNLVYVVGGAGPDEEYLKQLANSFPQQIKSRIIFLGKTTEEEKWTWFNLCDDFVMPSRNIEGDFEGFGIVYLEANLAGKPVIAGDSGGVRDAVIDGVNGILVNPENLENIIEAIVTLVKNKEVGRKLGEQGRERVIKEFSWENKIEEVKKIIYAVK